MGHLQETHHLLMNRRALVIDVQPEHFSKQLFRFLLLPVAHAQ
jgi:hypothetical protein